MALLLENAPIPFNDPIANPPRSEDELGGRPDNQVGLVGASWVDFFTRLNGAVDASNTVLNTVSADTQSASIGATDFTAGGINTGLYFLAFYARITRAATTSSSLQVTFSWTESGVALSRSSTAMTGNTTTTVDDGLIMVLADAGTPVTYSTTYASSGATSMQYLLRVVLIRVA